MKLELLETQHRFQLNHCYCAINRPIVEGHYKIHCVMSWTTIMKEKKFAQIFLLMTTEQAGTYDKLKM